MKVILAGLVMLTMCKNLNAQSHYNKPDHCKKTVWTHLGGSYQVDTYNSNNGLIFMVQVSKEGDTTQIMTYEYDAKGREIKHVNRMGKRIEFESRTEYDQDSATVVTRHLEKTLISKHKLGSDEIPVFTSSEECAYTYNQDSSLETEVCRNRYTHEVDSVINKYDKRKNLIKQICYSDNVWRWTDERKYNARNQEVKRVQTDVYRNKHITYKEYDKEGRLIRNYGDSNKKKWEMLYEYFSCQ